MQLRFFAEIVICLLYGQRINDSLAVAAFQFGDVAVGNEVVHTCFGINDDRQVIRACIFVILYNEAWLWLFLFLWLFIV